MTSPAAPGVPDVAVVPLRRGDHGPSVRVIRDVLAQVGFTTGGGDVVASGNDGVARARHAAPTPVDAPSGAAPEYDPELFDEGLERAVQAFQQRRRLVADGVVGAQTARILDGARWRLGDRILLHTPGHLMRGDDVAALQERLLVLGVHHGRVDGLFGPDTETALKELQQGLGLSPDGICGPETLAALAQVSPRAVTGGDAWALRQQADVAVAGKSLAGKVIVLDPAHGGDDPGIVAGDLHEADLMLDLAQRVEGRLAASGITVALTRGRNGSPDSETRAQLAADLDADVVLSLHCARNSSAEASGLATFYWGDERVGTRSAVGHRLAGLLQREILHRTSLVDCRTHASTIDIVRLTRMPAVQLELGYLTNPGDAHRLEDPAWRDVVADAIVVAVQRLYLGEEDARTGTLNVKDVLARAARP